MTAPRAAVFQAGAFRAIELGANDVPRLQAFFDANPDYSLRVGGRAPMADAARTELAARPPDGWPYTKRWLLGTASRWGSASTTCA